jgi:hypothetical protein
LLVSSSLVLTSAQGWAAVQADQAMAQPMGQAAPQPSEATAQAAPQSPEQLDQIVAPIALYPDALVAQVLAAATYPTEVAEADRWMQQHSGLKGKKLAQAVDKQSWDPSVKALTQFPSVLANMDKDISWTSALGEAYANQPQDVLNAVQAMREQAQQAGNLEEHVAGDRDDRGTDDRDSTGKPPDRLRAGIRSLAYLRSAPRGLSRLGPHSGKLRCRAVPFVRPGHRDRDLRRVRLGMAPLGSRLARPQRCLQS